MDSQKKSQPGVIAAIVALTALVYAASLRFAFVYDDVPYLLQNPRLTSWSSLPSYFTQHVWAHVSTFGVYYRPLFVLWCRLNYWWFGVQSPTPWHLTTVLLHLLAVVLVFHLLRRTLNSETAIVVGTLVFALHPGHVESVAWISGCTEPLMACALLGSLLCWFHRHDRLGIVWFAASLLLFLCALLVKETAVITPALILIYAITDTPGSTSERSRKAVLAAVPYGIVAAAELLVRHRLMPVAASSELHPLSQVLATTPAAVVFYARHLIWPTGLSPFYSLSISHTAGPTSSAIAFLVATLLVFLALRSRGTFIAVCWIVLPLVPALVGLRFFDRTDVVHDRYLYLSTIGLGMLLGMGIARIRSGTAEILRMPAAPFAATAVLIIALVAGTTSEMRPWLNNLTLFVRGTQVAPQSPPAYSHLAYELYKRGNPHAARALYSKAIALDGQDWGANFGLAVLDMRLGDLNQADDHFERAIAIQPQATNATYLMQAQVRLQAGRAAAAEESVRKAIELWPQNASQHALLGQILMAEQKPQQAKAEFERELFINPGSPEAQSGLAQLSN